jgi:hypothetical protein
MDATLSMLSGYADFRGGSTEHQKSLSLGRAMARNRCLPELHSRESALAAESSTLIEVDI